MLYRTHMITSITAAVALHEYGHLPLGVASLLGVAAGSLLPDIDEPGSYIGRRTRGFSDLIHKIFGHRGFTHSILAGIIMFIPLFLVNHPSILGNGFLTFSQRIPWLYTLLKEFFYGVGVGYYLHIAGDLFSKQGVPLFMPFSKKDFSIYLYITGGTRELIIRYVSLICLAFLVYHLFFHATSHLLGA